MIIFRGEPVEIESIEGDNAEDAFVSAAYWTKTGVDLTAQELEDLTTERADVVVFEWMQMMIGKAEDRADLMAGR